MILHPNDPPRTLPTAHDLVIEELADSEAALRDELVQALADSATYRECFQSSLGALYRACLELERLHTHHARLAEECRDYRRRLDAAREHYRRLRDEHRRQRAQEAHAREHLHR